jgi:chromosome segregation ATPase
VAASDTDGGLGADIQWAVAEIERLAEPTCFACKDIADERDEAKAEIERLQKENSDLHIKLSQYEPGPKVTQLLDEARQQRDEAVAEIERLRQRVTDTRSAAVYNERLSDQSLKIDALTEECREAREEIERLRAEIKT